MRSNRRQRERPTSNWLLCARSLRSGGYSADEEAIIRERLSGLGYIE